MEMQSAQLASALEALKGLSVEELGIVDSHLVKLKKQKAAAKQREFLAEMRAKASREGLDFESMVTEIASKKKKTKPEPKYRHPREPSKTWSGRGKKPLWLQSLLDGGTDLETMRI